MRDQLARRDERLRAGERQIGWTVGFGAPGACSGRSTGEVVITGSALPPHPEAVGQRVAVERPPLGALSLRLI